MVILFNVDGESRKAMVKAIENELGGEGYLPWSSELRVSDWGLQGGQAR